MKEATHYESTYHISQDLHQNRSHPTLPKGIVLSQAVNQNLLNLLNLFFDHQTY